MRQFMFNWIFAGQTLHPEFDTEQFGRLPAQNDCAPNYLVPNSDMNVNNPMYRRNSHFFAYIINYFTSELNN